VFTANYLAGASASRYPAGTLVTGVFTDQFVDPANGDFTVRTSSILRGAAPGGSDIGADYPSLAARLVGVQEGVDPTEPTPPTAGLSLTCTYLVCAFNDTSTAGSAAIVGWSWTFGDGGTSNAASGTHSYSAAGTYTVTLTVVDANGRSDSESSNVTVAAPPANVAPTAAFDYACVDLRCTFTDRSTDSDGTVASWAWTFGTAGTANVASPTFTFPAPGNYEVALTVTDDDGATASVMRSVEVSARIHNAFLSATTERGGNSSAPSLWKATVVTAVHTSDEQPVAGATLVVAWSGATTKTASCVTGTTGQCTFKTGALSVQKPSVTLTVTSISAPNRVYEPAGNHSQVAGSNGTTITIVRP
jgi:PKD repeat protein